MGPLTAPVRCLGTVAGLLKATCPGKQVKANLSRLYSSTHPSSHRFLSEAPFCFWSAPEHCCPELCCLKDKWNLSLFQTKLETNIFLPPLSASAVCLGYLPSHCPLLIPHRSKHFHTGFSLSCISQLSSTLQRGTKHGQRTRAKPSCTSPKQTLIWPFNWNFTSNASFPVAYLHSEADCISGGLLMFFPVLLPTNLAGFLFQN